ncbi:MAG: histidine kinase [Actinomycetes bacterium]|nr:histidine kinase [Actinomycetes bacterium]MDX5379848.1 histidine kinase [Actinomycetes bacterium]MDX5398304.1 histidine kinase [Actinomycetes bacterium]MDX5449549.1 histidine kinase [Actinomycetes bacterium]
MTTTSPPAARRGLLSDALPGMANVMVSFALALTWGVAMIVAIAVGAALVPVFGIGLLVLLGALWLLRLAFAAERRRARAVYDLPVPDLSTWPSRPGENSLVRSWRPIGNGEYWRSFAHHVLKLLLGLTGGSIFLWLATTAVAGLATPGTGAVSFEIVPGAFILPSWAPAVGGVLLLLALAVLWGAALIDRALDSALLSVPAEQLQRKVLALEDAREGAERAAAAERARIERDLHDGAQPRLVNLAMTLGMAKAKLDTDPQAARAMIDEAHSEAKAAVNDLRQLARGIHPAVLTDRGLDAALSALAAASPIPVRVRVDLAERLPRTLESTAYFVVAEALTNAAKHSGASQAEVVVTRDGDRARVVVFDNGTGGAHITPGTDSTGLAGLAERVRAAQGTLHITSPVGGPTLITVELPCA